MLKQDWKLKLWVPNKLKLMAN